MKSVSTHESPLSSLCCNIIAAARTKTSVALTNILLQKYRKQELDYKPGGGLQSLTAILVQYKVDYGY